MKKQIYSVHRECTQLELEQWLCSVAMNSNSVTHNEAKGQFEIVVENQTSLLQYLRSGNTISLVHTEVPEPLRGRGLSNQLIRAALDFAHFHQLKVIPVCSAVKRYLQDHPEAASSTETA